MGNADPKTGETATTWGGKKYNVQYVQQSDEDKALNSGRTFVQLNLPNNATGTNVSIGIEVEGPKETRIQQWLHYCEESLIAYFRIK